MARRPTQTDPYAILGVHECSTAAEIKRAYRERVLRCHPDIDPSPNAAAAFRNVHEAYRILSDPALRFRHEQRGRFAADHRQVGVKHKSRQRTGQPIRRASAQPRTWTDTEPDRRIDPWLFKGLYITGLLFGIACVGGISAGYLFDAWPPYMLVFMLPGLLVLPDCWEVLFAKAKAPGC